MAENISQTSLRPSESLALAGEVAAEKYLAEHDGDDWDLAGIAHGLDAFGNAYLTRMIFGVTSLAGRWGERVWDVFAEPIHVMDRGFKAEHSAERIGFETALACIDSFRAFQSLDQPDWQMSVEMFVGGMQLLEQLLTLKAKVYYGIKDGTYAQQSPARVFNEVLTPLVTGNLLWMGGEGLVGSVATASAEISATTALSRSATTSAALARPSVVNVFLADGVELLVPRGAVAPALEATFTHPVPKAVPRYSPPRSSAPLMTRSELPSGRVRVVSGRIVVGEGPTARFFEQLGQGVFREELQVRVATRIMSEADAAVEALLGLQETPQLPAVVTRVPMREASLATPKTPVDVVGSPVWTGVIPTDVVAVDPLAWFTQTVTGQGGSWLSGAVGVLGTLVKNGPSDFGDTNGVALQPTIAEEDLEATPVMEPLIEMFAVARAGGGSSAGAGVFSTAEKKFFIGRDPGHGGLQIDDALVRGDHLVIRRDEGGGYQIGNLYGRRADEIAFLTREGVTNQLPTQQYVQLLPGDIISVRDHHFQFGVDGENAQLTPVSSPREIVPPAGLDLLPEGWRCLSQLDGYRLFSNDPLKQGFIERSGEEPVMAPRLLRDGDVILLSGSDGMRLRFREVPVPAFEVYTREEVLPPKPKGRARPTTHQQDPLRVREGLLGQVTAGGTPPNPRLLALLDSPNQAVAALKDLPRDDVRELLSLAQRTGRLADLAIAVDGEYLPASGTANFQQAEQDLLRLEGEFLASYQEPARVSRTKKLRAVEVYFEESSTGNDDVWLLRLLGGKPFCDGVFERAKQDPQLLDRLYQLSQIAQFLGRRTRYQEGDISFVRLLATGDGVCENKSILFAHLASLIGLEVGSGYFPGHAFVMIGDGDVVVETTAQYWVVDPTPYSKKSEPGVSFYLPAYMSLSSRLNNLAVEQYRAGNYQKALELLDIVDGLNPNSSSVQYMRGIVYEAAGDVDQAVAAYETALARNPQNEKAKEALAKLRASAPEGVRSKQTGLVLGQQSGGGEEPAQSIFRMPVHFHTTSEPPLPTTAELIEVAQEAARRQKTVTCDIEGVGREGNVTTTITATYEKGTIELSWSDHGANLWRDFQRESAQIARSVPTINAVLRVYFPGEGKQSHRLTGTVFDRSNHPSIGYEVVGNEHPGAPARMPLSLTMRLLTSDPRVSIAFGRDDVNLARDGIDLSGLTQTDPPARMISRSHVAFAVDEKGTPYILGIPRNSGFRVTRLGETVEYQGGKLTWSVDRRLVWTEFWDDDGNPMVYNNSFDFQPGPTTIIRNWVSLQNGDIVEFPPYGQPGLHNRFVWELPDIRTDSQAAQTPPPLQLIEEETPSE